MDVIKKFSGGIWMERAKDCLNNSEKIKELLAKVISYLGKEGLDSVREQIELMYNYVKDIISGEYKGYSVSNLTMIIAAFIYLVSPLDILPDILPGGLIDDGLVLLWVNNEVKIELDKYKQFKNLI